MTHYEMIAVENLYKDTGTKIKKNEKETTKYVRMQEITFMESHFFNVHIVNIGKYTYTIIHKILFV